jgi:hypothetical protein
MERREEGSNGHVRLTYKCVGGIQWRVVVIRRRRGHRRRVEMPRNTVVTLVRCVGGRDRQKVKKPSM